MKTIIAVKAAFALLSPRLLRNVRNLRGFYVTPRLQLGTSLAARLCCFLVRHCRASLGGATQKPTGLLSHAPGSKDYGPALRPGCHISSLDPIGSRSAGLRRSPVGFYVTPRP